MKNLVRSVAIETKELLKKSIPFDVVERIVLESHNNQKIYLLERLQLNWSQEEINSTILCASLDMSGLVRFIKENFIFTENKKEYHFYVDPNNYNKEGKLFHLRHKFIIYGNLESMLNNLEKGYKFGPYISDTFIIRVKENSLI